MRKFMLATFVLISFVFITAKADNDRVIKKEKLPVTAQKFISTHFPGIKISYVKEERDFMEKNYEVVFTDGSKIEFSRRGEWKEVDCRYTEVPSAIVPDQIEKYISEHYHNEKVLQIDRNHNSYEVRLSNRLELTFDKNYNITDIDD